MKKQAFYIVGPDWANYSGMFRAFDKSRMVETAHIKEADIVCFTGGQDINPRLYNEQPHRSTYWSDKRDEYELAAFKETSPEQLKVGICRGAQLLNVLNGGTLWQDVDRHTSTHTATDVLTGKTHLVSSLHHQMMVPTKDAEIITVASESTRYSDENGDFSPVLWDCLDIEALWYGKTNSLLVQYHPEFSGYADCTKYFKETLFRYLS